MICDRWQHQASCHFLAVEPWHWFVLCQDKDLGTMVGQMLKCEYSHRRGLMYLLLPMWNVPTKGWSIWHQSVCYLFFFFEPFITKFLVIFWSTSQFLMVSFTGSELIFSFNGDCARLLLMIVQVPVVRMVCSYCCAVTLYSTPLFSFVFTVTIFQTILLCVFCH